MKITASGAILDRLAQEHRHVLSDWRALILLRRATIEISPEQRRWSNLPVHPSELSALFRQMQTRGEIAPSKDSSHLYEVTVPYANLGLIDDREILFELNPFAILSHLTALTIHGLTDDLPKRMFVSIPTKVPDLSLPIGTRADDWREVALPPGRTPDSILGRKVVWTRVQPERCFGYIERAPFGYPIRLTSLERTLIDATQTPELSGGVENVLRAWVRARNNIDVVSLLELVEQMNIAVLRQRVGYILESLQITHAILESWQEHAHRGGSSRLVGSRPFSSTFDERWNISLNAPVDVLFDEAA
jgi:predicted transcriptional regulator of viral defense system